MFQARIYRPLTGRVRFRIPYRPGNRGWIQSSLGCLPEWQRAERRWEIARRHFMSLVELLADEYGAVEVTADYDGRSKCSRLCLDASGMECVCACEGENHGLSRDGVPRPILYESPGGERIIFAGESGVQRVRRIVYPRGAR